ncbi:MAG TPA: FAD-dependent thymidylate synthase [Thermodesulfobacteriota bacterium]|nr:FAD-dependent thymidylate synthase [Thermodesulfobacteriota bacterium]
MPEEKGLTTNVIKNYVSNLDRDIYTVANLPEEVIAVIFAYVSRSPKSFRDNIETVIKEEQLGQERAAKFHEKWVLNYGHASVAEHAAVHLGVERVSRLFSSLLELSNEYLSFTEYSQRYQKPQKGDFYVPEELKDKPSLLEEYIELNNYLYGTYVQINDKLYDYLKRNVAVPKGGDEKAHLRALEKIAFEDARYALSLATYTNLGMTANARAIEDSLTKLLSNKYPEARRKAEEIKKEVTFSVPTLVKYANENKYIKGTGEELERITHSIFTPKNRDLSNQNPGVRLIDWTGSGTSDPEKSAIDKMVNAILFEYSDLGYDHIEKEAGNKDLENKLMIVKKAIERLGKHDNPINVFKLINYEAEFVISEACWHQLLRHRKVNWITQEPSVSNGITVPPNVEQAGSEELLREATQKSELFYDKLMNENLPLVASYVVTNAHNRRVIGSFDLWELYHLTNLRMSEGAQWDIKNIVGMLAKEISKHHPNLVAPALRRVIG